MTPPCPPPFPMPANERPNGRSILVVDDDDDIRQLVVLALELTTDWDVVTATGGEAAVTMAGLHLPDAVLMDMMMPGIDGLTAFEAMQAHEATRGIPVILVTAKLQAGNGRPWDGHAISGVIAKPFDPLTLAARVADLLGWTPSVSQRRAAAL